MLYSKNHNILRTVGFLAILAAVCCLALEMFGICTFMNRKRIANSISKVRNTRKGGCIICAPPCGSWVFLNPCCTYPFLSQVLGSLGTGWKPRSSPTTGRTWLDPSGFSTACCIRNNILVMRLLYMYLGFSILVWFDSMMI